MTFEIALKKMKIGDRISSGDGQTYGHNWEITRVPNGWIYVVDQTGHCVFVPMPESFEQPF